MYIAILKRMKNLKFKNEDIRIIKEISIGKSK